MTRKPCRSAAVVLLLVLSACLISLCWVDKVLAALRVRFGEKLHTQLTSVFERSFFTFRRDKSEQFHAYIVRFRVAA